MRPERERERERESKGVAGERLAPYCIEIEKRHKPFRNLKRNPKLGVLHTNELMFSQSTPPHSFIPLISSRLE